MALYDQLIVNAAVYPMEREGEHFPAMAVKNGRIAALFEQTPAAAGRLAARVIDAGGAVVLPGLIDSHFHFISTAVLREMALSISEIRGDRLEPGDLEGVARKVKAFAAGRRPELPLICCNYVIASIKEDRLPCREEMDLWLPGRAVMVLSMDGHSSAFSSEALKRIGMNAPNHNGIFSGVEHDMNLGRINSLIAKSLTLPLLASGVVHTVNDALRHGIVGICCLEGAEDDRNDMALSFLRRFGGILPLYLRLHMQYLNPARVLPHVGGLTYPRLGGCGAWAMDGSISSRTAAFYEPYVDDPQNFGKTYYTQQEVESYVKAAHENGFQISSHAIGTRGIEYILSAFEKVIAADRGENPRRHRIDHFEFPTGDQVERALKARLLLCPQPGYSWMDETFQKAYRKYLTEDQYRRQIPLRTIVEKGGIICGSSDSPIQHLNPFEQIHGMVNFPIESERLTVFQALRAYTWNGAYATFEEKERGTLFAGKWADFILMEEDPFKVPPSRLLELKVKETYIKGRRMRDMKAGYAGLLLRKLFTPSRKL